MSEVLRPPDGLSDDAFLGGSLQLLQPARGFRAGLDAVMLAAAIPVRAGESVLEAGLGNGAASLCLLRRVDDVTAAGVEIDHASAALAGENAARNGLATRLDVLTGDVETSGRDWQSRLTPNTFDHVFANPPFYLKASSRAPGDEARARAHQRDADALERWVKFLVTFAKADATLTLILPAAALGEAIAALAKRVGRLVIFPLFPREGEAATRIILQGRKGAKAAPVLLPGLVLHGAGNAFTPQAQAILRAGAALNLQPASAVPI